MFTLKKKSKVNNKKVPEFNSQYLKKHKNKNIPLTNNNLKNTELSLWYLASDYFLGYKVAVYLS